MSDGRRDPRVLQLLASRRAASVTEVQWARRLRVSGYLGPADLPDDLVVSVRCLVLVNGDVVVCTNIDGRSHAWPGGRRHRGEGFVATACREVHEETGWQVDAASLRPIGFLHLYNLGEPFQNYPHPDVFQVVMVGRASTRSAEEWTDVEGYELSSRLVPLAEARLAISDDEPMCTPFLDYLLNDSTAIPPAATTPPREG